MFTGKWPLPQERCGLADCGMNSASASVKCQGRELFNVRLTIATQCAANVSPMFLSWESKDSMKEKE